MALVPLTRDDNARGLAAFIRPRRIFDNQADGFTIYCIYPQERALLSEGYPVYGRVLAVDRKGRPSYSFVDSSGREHERVARVRPGLQVGASVEVIHPAGRPTARE